MSLKLFPPWSHGEPDGLAEVRLWLVQKQDSIAMTVVKDISLNSLYGCN